MFHTMLCKFNNCRIVFCFFIFYLLSKIYSAKIRIFGKVLVLSSLIDHNVFIFRLHKESLFLNVTISIKKNWFNLEKSDVLKSSFLLCGHLLLSL